jgi:hypothetical protein
MPVTKVISTLALSAITLASIYFAVFALSIFLGFSPL